MSYQQFVHVYDTPVGFPNVRVRSRVGRALAITLLAMLFSAFAFMVVDIISHKRSTPMQSEPSP